MDYERKSALSQTARTAAPRQPKAAKCVRPPLQRQPHYYHLAAVNMTLNQRLNARLQTTAIDNATR